MSARTPNSPRADLPALPAEIDVLLSQDLSDLVSAAREARVRVSYHALIRAALSGALASVKVAGRRQTSPRAVREWIARLNAPRDLPAPPVRRQRGRRAKPTTTAAERAVLEARGLPSRSRPEAK